MLFFILPHSSSYMVWNNRFFFHFHFCILTFTRLWRALTIWLSKACQWRCETVLTIMLSVVFPKWWLFRKNVTEASYHRSSLTSCSLASVVSQGQKDPAPSSLGHMKHFAPQCLSLYLIFGGVYWCFYVQSISLCFLFMTVWIDNEGKDRYRLGFRVSK